MSKKITADRSMELLGEKYVHLRTLRGYSRRKDCDLCSITRKCRKAWDVCNNNDEFKGGKVSALFDLVRFPCGVGITTGTTRSYKSVERARG